MRHPQNNTLKALILIPPFKDQEEKIMAREFTFESQTVLKNLQKYVIQDL